MRDLVEYLLTIAIVIVLLAGVYHLFGQTLVETVNRSFAQVEAVR